MAFLVKSELKTKSHIEIIDAITEGDDTIVDMIISESISFMKGYLTSRYDVTKIFSASGTNRDLVALKMLKALVIYEVYSSHNPRMMPQTVEDENKRAIAWLKAVQKGEINPALPLLSDDSSTAGYVKYGSNPKRENHY